MPKFVYTFGNGQAEGDEAMKELLGGKGAGLAEMNRLGIPVPPGFTITTEVCTYYYDHERKYPPELDGQLRAAVAQVEKLVGGARFGDALNPLLVSVRSGARVSMPGMMDTVLNLGLNDATVEGLAAKSGSARFAYDSYRRFVQMYGDVVLGLKPETKNEADPFEALLERKKEARGVHLDTELDERALRELVAEFKAEIKAQGTRLPRRSVGAAPGRHRRRLRQLGQPARRHLPLDVQHPVELGHGGHRAGDGLRQPGRRLRHRRRLHARSVDGREALLRRVPA